MKTSSNDFYNDIKYNLSILADTIKKIEDPSLIKKGESLSLDEGFIAIFANDIKELENLKFSPSKINELHVTLQSQAKKIRSFAGKTFTYQDKPVKSPIKPIDAELIEEIVQKHKDRDAKFNDFQENTIKMRLEQIGTEFDVNSIYGDGHCLYRSIATSLVQNMAQLPKFSLFADSIRKKCGENNPYLKNISFDDVENILKEIKNNQSAILNPKTSNELVQFLRLISSAYIHKQAEENKDYKETLVQEISVDKFDSIEDYLQKMISMKGARYAGEREILAFTNLLDIKIVVKDVAVLKDSIYDGSKDSKIEIPVLFAVNHYDLLIKKAT